MISRMKVEDPETIRFTITTTASAQEWENFREALDFVSNKSLKVPDAVYHYRNQIDDLLAQARKVYWAKTEEKKP